MCEGIKIFCLKEMNYWFIIFHLPIEEYTLFVVWREGRVGYTFELYFKSSKP